MTENNNSNPDPESQQHEESSRGARLTAGLAVAAVAIAQVVGSLIRAIRKPWPQLPASADTQSASATPGRPDAQVSSVPKPEFGAVDPIPQRTLDRKLDADFPMNTERRETWGLLLAQIASFIAVAGCIGFLIAYWFNPGNLLLGGSLALALGGLGATLVIWSRMLTVKREAIAPRESLLPPEQERNSAADAFTLGAQDICRRSMLRWISYSAAGMFALMAASLLRSLGLPSYAGLNSRIWKRGQCLVTAEGKAVSADTIQPGNTLTVFPEDSIGDERSQTVLIRVDPALLKLPEEREHWAPNGILAYSRVCTHAGCTVGLYEKTSHLLLCPCHQSTFDVLRAARPNGGPAARALPQLPIYVDSDGTLRAGGGFSEPAGPGFWGMA